MIPTVSLNTLQKYPAQISGGYCKPNFSSVIRKERPTVSPEAIQALKEQGFTFTAILEDYQRLYKRTLPKLLQAKTSEQLQKAIDSFFLTRFKGWDVGNRIMNSADLVVNHSENPFGIKYTHVNHELTDPISYFEGDSKRALSNPSKRFSTTKNKVITDFKNTANSFLSVLKIYAAVEDKTPADFSGKLTFFWHQLINSIRRRYQRENRALTPDGKNISATTTSENAEANKAVKVNKTDRYPIQVRGLDNLKALNYSPLNNPYEVYIILRNLITNAVKYTLNRSTIKVRFLQGWGVDSSGKAGRYLYASVEDPGIGIRPEEAYKVLTGHRTDSARLTGLHGQAMGFQEAIALTLKHRGAMYMASPTKRLKGEPRGTQVQVCIPLKDSELDKTPPIWTPPIAPNPSGSQPPDSTSPKVPDGSSSKNVLAGSQPIATPADMSPNTPTLVAFYPDEPVKSKRFKVTRTTKAQRANSTRPATRTRPSKIKSRNRKSKTRIAS